MLVDGNEYPRISFVYTNKDSDINFFKYIFYRKNVTFRLKEIQNRVGYFYNFYY